MGHVFVFIGVSTLTFTTCNCVHLKVTRQMLTSLGKPELVELRRIVFVYGRLAICMLCCVLVFCRREK